MFHWSVVPKMTEPVSHGLNALKQTPPLDRFVRVIETRLAQVSTILTDGRQQTKHLPNVTSLGPEGRVHLCSDPGDPSTHWIK